MQMLLSLLKKNLRRYSNILHKLVMLPSCLQWLKLVLPHLTSHLLTNLQNPVTLIFFVRWKKGDIKIAVWRSQVLIPFIENNNEFKFFGPLSSLSHLFQDTSFFPHHSDFLPLISRVKVNLDSFPTVSTSFRPMAGNPNTIDPESKKISVRGLFLKWISRMKGPKEQVWNCAGVYDFRMLRKQSVL